MVTSAYSAATKKPLARTISRTASSASAVLMPGRYSEARRSRTQESTNGGGYLYGAGIAGRDQNPPPVEPSRKNGGGYRTAAFLPIQLTGGKCRDSWSARE